MRVPRSPLAGRILAVLAVVSAPLFALFGWWLLAVSGFLAAVAALVSRRPRRSGSHGAIRSAAQAVSRRLNRHSWRPGRR